ncbi:hypothetical protein EAF04_004368 [Stromatinia cepivora]|nr:hypothetical protein EAF04_004368 [Stromatinia cepivora]
MVSQNQITPILAEGTIMNDSTNLGEFGGPAVDAQTTMACCRCGQSSPLDASAPGSTSCSLDDSPNHWTRSIRIAEDTLVMLGLAELCVSKVLLAGTEAMPRGAME